MYIYILHVFLCVGSALHGLRFQFAVRSLQAIDIKAHLDENWRPQLLLLYQLKEEEVTYHYRGALFKLEYIPCCSD